MRKITFLGLLALLGTMLIVAFPGTVIARVFTVLDSEDLIRSSKRAETIIRQFPVQYPGDYNYTLHVFYTGERSLHKGVVPRSLIRLNGKKIVLPREFKRKIHYIKKRIMLSEVNTLSVELRGKLGSGLRVVLTGENDEPQVAYFGNDILPDGRNLFGSEVRYLWTIIDEPEGGKAVLSDPFSSGPLLTVSAPGEYSIELRIQTDWWETDPFIVNLTAIAYPDFVPKPVETRVVNAAYTMKGITVGPNTYAPPAPMTCASYSNHGFQVLALDRGSLQPIDNRTFNTPCGNQVMIDFLSSLGDTSKYPVAPLVIVSSLGFTPPDEVCGNSPDCPLGRALEGLGGTSIFRSNYSKDLDYAIYIPDNNSTMGIAFTYSLIGIPGLGQNQGTELNNWDHRVVTAGSENINANIQGYFVQDINHKWTFAYPEFLQIETRTRATNGNTIKVGGDAYFSAGLSMGAVGGFQVLVLDRDTLKPAASLTETNRTFLTNTGTGTGSISEQEQHKMYDYLNSVRQSDPSQRFVVVIASIGNMGPPISYKSTVFTDLVKLIGDYYGGTTGILNNLGPAAPSIVTYSLIGMNNVGNAKYGLGALNAVEESAPNQNLKVVMHKDKQGWYEPATTYTGTADAASSPDFNLLSVALQPSVSWPLPNPSDPLYAEQEAAYQYISGQLGENTNNIRSLYVKSPITPETWYTTCMFLQYQPNTDFSEEVFQAMRTQLCDEFNYVSHVNGFMSDADELLQEMQIASGTTMETVYNMVKSTVGVDESAQAKWDALIVIRGMLKIASAIDPEPISSAIMGAVNGTLWLGMHLSKGPSGPDYTSIDTAVSSLKNEMNTLWTNCQAGKNIVLDMVKSDWGKLQYVGNKLITSQEQGGWKYFDTDKADWKTMATNSLEAYYFQSLIPAVWKIDYLLDTTTIPHPRNYMYHMPQYTYYCNCKPYCVQGNNSAFWVDQFPHEPGPYIYNWFVLEDGIDLNWTCACGTLQVDRSVNLRDVLFGVGPWASGQKLHLEPAVFYERWLPSWVYTHPMGYAEKVYKYGDCSY